MMRDTAQALRSFGLVTKAVGVARGFSWDTAPFTV